MRECEVIRQVLGDVVLEALPGEDLAVVRAHLEGCPACRRELEATRELHRGLRRLLEAAPPVDVRAAVMARLEPGRPAWRRAPLLAAAAVLAAVALLLHPAVRAQAAEAVRLVLNVATYVERVVVPSDSAGQPVAWLNEGGVDRLVLKVSPDGRKVWYGEGVRTDYFAASRYRWEPDARTYLANLADGSERVELPADVRALEWSPDGRWVVYADYRNGPAIVFQRADGGETRYVGPFSAGSFSGRPEDARPQFFPLGWSADGRYAYVWATGPGRTGLWSVDLDAGAAGGAASGSAAEPPYVWVYQEPEDGGPGAHVWRPERAWMSHDGRYLAIFKEYRDEAGRAVRMDLYVWLLPEGTQRLLATFDIPANPAQPPMAVAGWLPDNLTVLVSQGLDQAHPKLLSVRADGAGGVREVTEIYGPLLNVSPSPDGRWLALDDEGRLQVMAPDGTGRRELVASARYETLPRWLPDGSILYYRFGKESGWWRLYPNLQDEAGPATPEEAVARFMSGRLAGDTAAVLDLLAEPFRRTASVYSGTAPLLAAPPGHDTCWYRYQVTSLERPSADGAAARVRVYEHRWSGNSAAGPPQSWEQEVRLVRTDQGWRVTGLSEPRDRRQEPGEPSGTSISACWLARPGRPHAPWLERTGLPVDASLAVLAPGEREAWFTIDPATGRAVQRPAPAGVVPNERTLSGRYAVRVDGEGMRVVDTVTGNVRTIERAWSVHLSPDGRWAAVIPEVEGSTMEVVDLDTGRRFDLGPYGKPVSTSWSPDGRLALTKGNRLYLAAAPDWRVREVGPFPYVPVYWSPDGQWLAYVDRDAVKIVRPDLSQERTLVRVDLAALGPGGTSVGAPAWSPDGRLLAYAARDGVYVVEVATGRVRQVAQAGYPDVSWYRLLSWSPDGTALAFSPRYVFDEHGERGAAGIVVAQADGSGAYQLTRGEGVTVLDWTAEGIIAAFCCDGPR
ncbi:MAG TPA: zf-HC2 domain-containing protein [Dehalococcoidia bacterium]